MNHLSCEPDSYQFFAYADTNILNSTSESADYAITVKENGELYFYMNRVNMEERFFQINVNGTFISMYGNASCQKVIDLGYYNKGEVLSLQIITDGREVPYDIVVATEMLR